MTGSEGKNDILFWVMAFGSIAYSLYLNAGFVMVLVGAYLLMLIVSGASINVDERDIRDILVNADVPQMSEAVKVYIFNVVIFILMATLLFTAFYV